MDAGRARAAQVWNNHKYIGQKSQRREGDRDRGDRWLRVRSGGGRNKWPPRGALKSALAHFDLPAGGGGNTPSVGRVDTPLQIYVDEVTTTSATVYCAFPEGRSVDWDALTMVIQYQQEHVNATMQSLQLHENATLPLDTAREALRVELKGLERRAVYTLRCVASAAGAQSESADSQLRTTLIGAVTIARNEEALAAYAVGSLIDVVDLYVWVDNHAVNLTRGCVGGSVRSRRCCLLTAMTCRAEWVCRDTQQATG